MFQFGGFPTYTYVFSVCFIVLHYESFLIRISADRGLFAAPRSFSQLVASFFGSWCQGIHLMLFFAWTISSSLFFELLEFLWTFSFGLLIHVKRFYPFALNLFLIPPRGEIVVIITQIGKTLIDLTNLVKSIIVLLSVRFLLFITLFGFQWT